MSYIIPTKAAIHKHFETVLKLEIRISSSWQTMKKIHLCEGQEKQK